MRCKVLVCAVLLTLIKHGEYSVLTHAGSGISSPKDRVCKVVAEQGHNGKTTAGMSGSKQDLSKLLFCCMLA